MKFSSYSSLYCFRLYDKLTYIAIYKGKYLQRRIPHASHGSFNPYIITNKEAHIINFARFSSDLQNPNLPQDEASELEQDLTKDELLNALKGFQPDKTPGMTVSQKNFMKPSSNCYGGISSTLSTKRFKQANCLYLREGELFR